MDSPLVAQLVRVNARMTELLEEARKALAVKAASVSNRFRRSGNP